MTQFLPPNLLALFAPREPIPYLPPSSKLPTEKKNVHVSSKLVWTWTVNRLFTVTSFSIYPCYILGKHINISSSSSKDKFCRSTMVSARSYPTTGYNGRDPRTRLSRQRSNFEARGKLFQYHGYKEKNPRNAPFPGLNCSVKANVICHLFTGWKGNIRKRRSR